MVSSAPQWLFIDLETFSSANISSCGAFRYVEAPDFEVLLFAYAWGFGPVQQVDLACGGKVPAEVLAAIADPAVVKVAHNCAFERSALRVFLGENMPAEQWVDTMVMCAMAGLPLSLDAAGAALNIENKKLKSGTALITYFCGPCKPTKANGQRCRNLPQHAPEKWAAFKKYSLRDVEAMQELYQRTAWVLPLISDFERSVWCADAAINDRGVMVDRDLCSGAVGIFSRYSDECVARMVSLTGLENPGSVAQLKGWLETRGVFVESLSKEAVEGILETSTDPIVREVLRLRLSIGKTSLKKYETMLAACCSDGRVRGLTQYYGAGRSGRWAGRLVQLQNMTKNHIFDELGSVRELVRAGDLEMLQLIYGDPADMLSQLVRTALVARPGCTFLVADYSAIEARVIAYLAGEKWRIETFAAGGDIYCDSASQMFGVPVVKHGINGELRAKGKIAELACGYGGGVGALRAFGADKMGLTEEEMQTIVANWRAASPTIPALWREAEKAARFAIENPGKPARMRCGVTYRMNGPALLCFLPSGRWITYYGARISDGSIVYMGGDQARAWVELSTWGGKLVENIVQAFARDCLAAAIVRLEAAGFPVCFHVHDEVIVEAPLGSSWHSVADIMGQPLDWAPGLLLRAAGYETKFYMKDD